MMLKTSAFKVKQNFSKMKAQFFLRKIRKLKTQVLSIINLSFQHVIFLYTDLKKTTFIINFKTDEMFKNVFINLICYSSLLIKLSFGSWFVFFNHNLQFIKRSKNENI